MDDGTRLPHFMSDLQCPSTNYRQRCQSLTITITIHAEWLENVRINVGRVLEVGSETAGAGGSPEFFACPVS